jgi:repressor LexA
MDQARLAEGSGDGDHPAGRRAPNGKLASRIANPLVGRIAAGSPILAEQDIEDVFALPQQLVGDGELFLLKVVGDSMVDAAICDGDFVVIRSQNTCEQGEIVAAMIDGDATVKTFKKRDGHVWLLPANSSYAPILGDEATILGKVHFASERRNLTGQ